MANTCFLMTWLSVLYIFSHHVSAAKKDDVLIKSPHDVNHESSDVLDIVTGI